MGVPLALHPYQHLALWFASLVILIGVCWYLIVLTCIPLMTYNVGHIFTYFFIFCIYSWVKCLIRYLAHPLSCFLMGCCLKFQEFFLYFRSLLLYFASISSMTCLPIFFTFVFTEHKFLFNKVHLSHSFIQGFCLWCCIWKVITIHTQDHLGFLLGYLLGILVLCFYT